MTAPGSSSQPNSSSPYGSPPYGGSFPTAAAPAHELPAGGAPSTDANSYRTASLPNIYAGAATQNYVAQNATTNCLDDPRPSVTVAASSHQQPFQPPQQAVINNLFVSNSSATSTASPPQPNSPFASPPAPPRNSFATPPRSTHNFSGQTIQASSSSPTFSPSNSPVSNLSPSGMPPQATYVEASTTTAESSRSPDLAGERTPSGSAFALDGYCCVTLHDENRWVLGNSRWGARHRGHIYLFQSAVAQQQFLADPDKYSPVLGGYDPVVLRETGQYEPGDRSHGVRYQDQMFLFSSEDTLQRFWKAPWQYAELARQAMLSDAMSTTP